MCKKIMKTVVLSICFVLIVFAGSMMKKVNAKAQEILSESYVDIGKCIFEFADVSRNQEEIEFKNIIQYSKSTAKKTILVKKSTSENIVTNGKYLYYSKFKGDKGIIYKMNIKTKKISKVASGKKCVLLGGTDQYLYIGRIISSRPTMEYKMYIYNMSTKQIKLKNLGYYTGGVQVDKKKILYCEPHTDAGDHKFSVMTESGKTIFNDKATMVSLSKGKVLYYQILYYKDKSTIKYYLYNLYKKSKKEISKKVYEKYTGY